MHRKRIISLLLAFTVAFLTVSLCGCGDKEFSEKIFMYKVDKGDLLFNEKRTAYSQYINSFADIKSASEDIVLNAAKINSADSPEYYIELNDEKYAFIDRNSNWVEWELEVPSTAFYNFEVDYKTVEGNTENILLNMTVDGKNLYDEMQNFTLYRRWKDNTISGDFEKDDLGNDIRPLKIEEYADIRSVFLDEKGYHPGGFGAVLDAGKHTLRLKYVNNGVLIKKLTLAGKKDKVTYDEYISSVSEKGSSVKDNIVIEAEHPSYTNSTSLYAVNDWISAATTPNSPKNTMLNAIGDSNWKTNGQHLTWEFSVEKSGWYEIALRARQDYSEGMNTYRALYIDGKLPFSEARTIKFPYDFDWKTSVIGGEKPYSFWLEEGNHTLSLEVDTTSISDTLLDLESLINDLNLIYRRIIIITGTTVDIYQDYDLEIKIPQLINSFKDCANRMRRISANITKANETEGSIASVLEKTASLLDVFVAHPYQISGKLAAYKTDVDDISSLLTNMSQQALLLDKIILLPRGNDAPENDIGFFGNLKFSLLKYIDSYSSDKSVNNDKKTVKVWVSTGRDQAQIIKQMIGNSYPNSKKISVDLSIVDTGNTLIQATLAGRGPDIALSLTTATPVNLAMRGGLIDLSEYVKDVYNDFYESAWEQLKYQDGIYGIPETQMFDMLFIRDDIFKEIGLSGSPKTWDEFYKCMETIQNNNLMVGVLETNSANIAVSGGISTFSKMYFQQGETFFNDNFSKTTFSSEKAIEAMNRVTDLYVRYGLDRNYDFFNRFRSGELVMGISSYNSYNQLVAAAPEISGLWSMYPVPGTRKADGSINAAENSSGTASVVLNAAKEHGVLNEAVDFVLWWTGADAQSEFAERLEGVMGVAARYTPANIKTFDSIHWSDKESSLIKEQWEQVYNVREIPGNYYIERSLTSAIRNTISGKNSIRYNMTKYTNNINLEITRKREEFGLE